MLEDHVHGEIFHAEFWEFRLLYDKVIIFFLFFPENRLTFLVNCPLGDNLHEMLKSVV